MSCKRTGRHFAEVVPDDVLWHICSFLGKSDRKTFTSVINRDIAKHYDSNNEAHQKIDPKLVQTAEFYEFNKEKLELLAKMKRLKRMVLCVDPDIGSAFEVIRKLNIEGLTMYAMGSNLISGIPDVQHLEVQSESAVRVDLTHNKNIRTLTCNDNIIVKLPEKSGIQKMYLDHFVILDAAEPLEMLELIDLKFHSNEDEDGSIRTACIEAPELRKLETSILGHFPDFATKYPKLTDLTISGRVGGKKTSWDYFNEFKLISSRTCLKKLAFDFPDPKRSISG